MKPRKIIVAGCSFSDYLKDNRTVYGRCLARRLKFKYKHQGAGCGSNWRIWRVISGLVMSGKITSRDLVIIQYTGLERREFWSRWTNTRISTVLGSSDREIYGDGHLIRYKVGAEVWQDHPAESEFFKIYEQDHVYTDYERELFDQEHFKFQLLLKHYDIPAVFIDGRHTPVRPLPLINPYSSWVFNEPVEWALDKKTWYDPEDYSHLCDDGHRQFANLLYQHIDRYNILNCYK